MAYTKYNPVSLENHPEYDEPWLNDQIEKDPSILGLGDIELVERERRQLAGRVDFIFKNDDDLRYVVEVQLGPPDESHIVRAIEYWDIESKRYPNYDHCAVLVAEDVAGRFLNVISLLNRSIPIILIQVQAIKLRNSMTLVFTKVLDDYKYRFELARESENSDNTNVNRRYWENKSRNEVMSIVDSIYEITKKLDSNLALNYTKHYIGLKLKTKSCNFIEMRTRKTRLVLSIKLSQSDEVDRALDKTLLDAKFSYTLYEIRLGVDDTKKYSNEITKLVEMAYESRLG